MTSAIVHLSASESKKIKIETKKLAWDWLAAGFFLAAVTIAGLRLVSTQWTDHLLGIALLALLAAGIGLLIGRSHFPRWLAYMYGVFYGAFFIPLVLSSTISETLAGDERLRQLAQKFFTAIGQVSEGSGTGDPILFLLAIAIIAWTLGVYSGFRFSRDRNRWATVLSFGIFILIIQTYDPLIPGRVWFVAVFLAFALLLIQRIRLLNQGRQWEKEKVHQPQGTEPALQRLALEVVLVSILVAWMIPSLPTSLDEAEQLWKRITSPVQNLERNVERALDPLQGPTGGSGGLFGSTLALGRGSTHGDAVVFSVEPLTEEPDVRHYYWRDRIYDHYEDGTWTSTFTESEDLAADEQANWANEQESRTPFLFQVTVERATSLLHLAPQLVQLNISSRIDVTTNPDETVDLAATWADTPLAPNGTYQMESSVTAATVVKMEVAGEAYPQWVVDRYLQVPAEISDRTRLLAERLTQDEPNPYEIAETITDYLRKNIAYKETLPIIPNPAEPIDWMLFDQKEAFCNYYASAEVILLRLSGVPARLAVGYSQGTRSVQLSGRAKYTVRDRDLHAWPEVYFPGMGWVEFEPTANQAVLLRPGQTIDQSQSALPPRTIANSDDTEINPPQTLPGFPEPQISTSPTNSPITDPWLSVAILVSAVIIVFYALLRRQAAGPIRLPHLLEQGFENLDLKPPTLVTNWARWDQSPKWSRPYMRINTALKRIDNSIQPGSTPEQRALALGKHLPDLESDIFAVSRDYQQRLYGIGMVETQESSRKILLKVWFRSEFIAAKQAIQKLRGQLKQKIPFWRQKPSF